MNRHTDRATLIGNRARHGLTNPPRRIGGELVTAPVVELLYRAHKSDVAFLNQVGELETAAAVDVVFGDRHNKAKVRFDHLAPRLIGLCSGLQDLAQTALYLDRAAAEALLYFAGLAASSTHLLAQFLFREGHFFRFRRFAVRVILAVEARVDLRHHTLGA